MKKKILYIDHQSEIGGAELSMLEFIENSIYSEYQFIVAIPKKGELEKRLKSIGSIKIKLIRIDSWRWWEIGFRAKLKFFLTLPLQIFNIFKWYFFIIDEKPDIIHFNLTRLIEPLFASKLTRIPTIMHFREDPINNKDFLLGENILFKILNLADFWIANSNTTYNYINSFQVNKLIEVIPNGINLKKFNNQNVSKFKKFTILKLALLVPWKNHFLFLKIAREVLYLNPNIDFIIAGDGNINYKKQLISMAQNLGILKNIKFVGFVNNPEILLNQVHLLLHTSANESFGRVYVEAMASMIPVIAIKGGSADEIIQHGLTGFTFNDFEISKIVEKIIDLSENMNLYDNIKNNAKNSALNKYSLETYSINLLKFYEQILKN